MMKSKGVLALTGLALLALVVVGCKIVSGTFVLVESFSFTTQTGFYPTAVDLTENSTWKEHEDDIDRIEVVGFELWITNNETSEWTYTGYVHESTMPDDTLDQADVDSLATLVFGPLTVPAGTPSAGTQRFVTYAESLGLLSNISTLQSLVKGGVFDYYAIATGGSGGLGGQVDSIRIIITLAAKDS